MTFSRTLVVDCEAVPYTRLDMAPKFGSYKHFAQLGFGIFIGTVGKTLYDRYFGLFRNDTAHIEVNDVDYKYGIPNRTTLLKNNNYIVGYNTSHKIPDWVFQRISKDCIDGQAKREKCSFKEDPRISKLFSSSYYDYQKSGFSRGHMASAGDYRATQQMMDDTFYYTNIVPQNTENNKGIWYRIECYCRNLAEIYSNVFVVSGPLFIAEKEPRSGKKFIKYPVIGPNEVAVPTHLYKVILVEKENKPFALGTFVFPNKQLSPDSQLTEFSCPLSFVEERLGYEIFPKLHKESLKNLCVVENCGLNPNKFHKKSPL